MGEGEGEINFEEFPHAIREENGNSDKSSCCNLKAEFLFWKPVLAAKSFNCL